MSESRSFQIEIDGVALEAQPGEMVIHVADRAGVHIPRFCYHEKLSIAANCRMCMVEVEKVPKPLPACATPVADGMKVKTRSKLALEGQRGTMEFLLINHPLDCPICDQGGECELQDIAMGYGSDVSRFNEGKRVVFDKNIGPLIATDMTRCIHCTRCVRFGTEIAAMRELGATGRGEHMEIGTFIENSVDSELSGNMIDVCPVGALTAKPSRFKARAWELIHKPGLALHDSLGSNVGIHVRRNTVFRVVPVPNDEINEVWLSDRDRFSYQGLYHADRLTQPLIRTENGLEPASWDQALDLAASLLQAVQNEQGGAAIGGLFKANESLEAMAAFRALMDQVGSPHCDHRLRQSDFRTDELSGVPCLTITPKELETAKSVLLIGSDLCKEQPLLAHRIRKMVAKGGRLLAINPVEIDYRCSTIQLVEQNNHLINEIAALLKAVCDAKNIDFDARFAHLLTDNTDTEALEAMAQGLLANPTDILLGGLAQSHPDLSLIISLASELARITNGRVGHLYGESNALGAQVMNLLPGADGLNAQSMLQQPRSVYVLAGVEPEDDAYDPALMRQALHAAQGVIAFSRYRDPLLDQCASVVFPISGFAETAGSYLNLSGVRQTTAAAIKPADGIRTLDQALHALRGRLNSDEPACSTSQPSALEQINLDALVPLQGVVSDLQPRCSTGRGLLRVGGVPSVRCDDLVRHASALQETAEAKDTGVHIHPDTAYRLGMQHDAYVSVQQAGVKVQVPLKLDASVALDTVWLPSGTEVSRQLGAAMGSVELSRTLL